MPYQLCHFEFDGDFDVQDVTQAMSLRPSSTIEKGELLEIDGDYIPARIASWHLDGPDGLSINQQIEFILRTLWERASVVKELASRLTAQIVIVFTAESGAHNLRLEPEALRMMADMEVTLHCDRIGDEDEFAD